MEKPIKNKSNNQPPASGGSIGKDNFPEKEMPEDVKNYKCSIRKQESRQFHKGEYKHIFAYAVETACDVSA